MEVVLKFLMNFSISFVLTVASKEESRASANTLALFAFREAKIVHNFGLSECNRVKHRIENN